MVRWFERLFAGAPAPLSSLYSPDGDVDRRGATRFRPRLIAQLLQDHADLRAAMRTLLDACRQRDEDGRITSLREVAAIFRQTGLAKATQLYPYLRWGLENDRFAVRQFEAIHTEVLRAMRGVDAMLEEYLAGPWLHAQRRRFVADAAAAARSLAGALKLEEASVFPLYLPPGQYRHVRGEMAQAR